MSKFKILDCTLRDGGYINSFKFGKNVMIDIIDKLGDSNIDIIECGFLNRESMTSEHSVFSRVSDIRSVISNKHKQSMYVAMIQYGELSPSELAENDGTSIDGIRLTFHEHEIDGAFEDGAQMMKLGYKVFMQPVGTLSYSDSALIDLIKRINEMQPYAFYLVDTLGTMYADDLLRLFYLTDKHLASNIPLGIHLHNNLQLAFSNAQAVFNVKTDRTVIVDTSVFGMGRGAGNLCTELVVKYLNDKYGYKYNLATIIDILDLHIQPLRLKYSWGYSAPYFIASINDCHPNYATYLIDKQTLQTQDINNIIKSIPAPERNLYNKKCIEELYLSYQTHNINDEQTYQSLTNKLSGQDILLIAPGASVETHFNRIENFIDTNKPIIISINFVPSVNVDFTYISNLKRYHSLRAIMFEDTKSIITSNITTEGSESQYVINYSTYLNDDDVIKDNAGLMCINLLESIGVNSITLAGFDGYSMKHEDNYYDDSLERKIDIERTTKFNSSMLQYFNSPKRNGKISFVTPSAYQVGEPSEI